MVLVTRNSEEITYFYVPSTIIIFTAAKYSYGYTEIVKLNIIYTFIIISKPFLLKKNSILNCKSVTSYSYIFKPNIATTYSYSYFFRKM